MMDEIGSPLLDKGHWLAENELAACVDQKGFEASKGHCLIVPKRIVSTVWGMSFEEWRNCIDLLHIARARIDVEFHPDGYNIEINCGEAAGQTIPYAHIHLIPRFKGDHPNPRGGVRAAIPGKADWTER